jgi:hypothetical protein
MATLVGTQTDLNSLLASIIELDFDAVDAYGSAIARVSEDAVRNALGAFKADHLRHIEELCPVLEASGRKAPQSSDYKHVLTAGKVVIAGLLGDAAVLTALKADEEDSNAAYEHACDSAVVPPRVRTLLRAALADERRHRTWIAQRLATL